MINGSILILKLLISHFLMEMFLALLPMVYTYISQLTRFARVCSNVDDVNNGNKFLLIILKQGKSLP